MCYNKIGLCAQNCRFNNECRNWEGPCDKMKGKIFFTLISYIFCIFVVIINHKTTIFAICDCQTNEMLPNLIQHLKLSWSWKHPSQGSHISTSLANQLLTGPCHHAIIHNWENMCDKSKRQSYSIRLHAIFATQLRLWNLKCKSLQVTCWPNKTSPNSFNQTISPRRW